MNDDVFRPGELCGTYRIVRLLGRGGFADVYQAVDVTTQQKVALKCLQLRHLTNARITQRMVAETELLAGLDHPNVVQVEDAGINGGVLWLAMEYLSGKTLRERLRAARGPLAPEVALYYARQIGEGVAAAHELNVVHRDLKPENIMITAKDEVKVLDLGAAKFFDRGITSTGTDGAIGTPLYMSPEQIKAEEVDVRADVYALGMILYEMLAGRHAFAQPNGELPPAFEIGTLQLHAQPKPLTSVGKGVPVSVWQLVEKAIAKDPAARFASMAHFARAIRATLRTVLEGAVADQLWDDVMADPGPERADLAEPTEAERVEHESREAPLRAEPKADAVAEPEERAETKGEAELRAVPEAKEVARKKKSSAPFVPNGGEEVDPDEEPHSGIRNVMALNPAGSAVEAPPAKPAPALARVVRIGPGGRQGEIVPSPEPAAASGEVASSGGESAAPAVVPLVAGVAAAAAPVDEVAAGVAVEVAAAVPVEVAAAVPVEVAVAVPVEIAVAVPVEVAVAVPVDAAVPIETAAVVPLEIAAAVPLETAAAPSSLVVTGAPIPEAPLQVISDLVPPAALDVAGPPAKLDEAPPPAILSLWDRLRATLHRRSRARAAYAIAPVLVVLLFLALRPTALVPIAKSALPDSVPRPAPTSPQAPGELPPEPGLASAALDPPSPSAADAPIPEDAPAKSRSPGARRGRSSTQQAARDAADGRPTSQTLSNTTPALAAGSPNAVSEKAAAPQGCESMLFVPSDYRRCALNSRAPAPTAAGQGKL